MCLIIRHILHELKRILRITRIFLVRNFKIRVIRKIRFNSCKTRPYLIFNLRLILSY
jgi:hypothetical protein